MSQFRFPLSGVPVCWAGPAQMTIALPLCPLINAISSEVWRNRLPHKRGLNRREASSVARSQPPDVC